MLTIKSERSAKRKGIRRWFGRVRRGSRRVEVIDLVAYRAEREQSKEKKHHG